MANGGTLFLDEIGDLPLDLQPKLLRVIQEREMFRVAGTRSISLNIRFLFATHKDLQKEVEARRFREDLFYRITTVFIKIPPLRERKEEIIPLAQLFLKQIAAKKHLPMKFLKSETARLLTDNPWLGNVRELLSAMERAYLITDETKNRPDYFPFLLPNATLNLSEGHRRQFFLEFPPDSCSLAYLEHNIVAKALILNKNNKTQTAKYLGISLNRLKRLLARY
jgi:DNA-binding NtrC family response regulator